MRHHWWGFVVNSVLVRREGRLRTISSSYQHPNGGKDLVRIALAIAEHNKDWGRTRARRINKSSQEQGAREILRDAARSPTAEAATTKDPTCVPQRSVFLLTE